MKLAVEPAGNVARAIWETTDVVALGRACSCTARYETPRKSVIAIPPRTASVMAAFRPWGRRKALTPLDAFDATRRWTQWLGVVLTVGVVSLLPAPRREKLPQVPPADARSLPRPRDPRTGSSLQRERDAARADRSVTRQGPSPRALRPRPESRAARVASREPRRRAATSGPPAPDRARAPCPTCDRSRRACKPPFGRFRSLTTLPGPAYRDLMDG